MNETLEKYQELAKTFLTKKERVNYYETTGYDDLHDENVGMLVELSDEEISKLRDLKARYGEEFVNHLIEVFDDEDVISDMFYAAPVDIDIDTVYHQYRFTLSEVDGDKVSSRQVLIELSDKEYSKLLALHLFDCHLVINTLFYRDEKLARRLMHEALRYKCDEDFPVIDHPFVIVMDEALADADLIRQENGIVKSEGYLWLSF